MAFGIGGDQPLIVGCAPERFGQHIEKGEIAPGAERIVTTEPQGASLVENTAAQGRLQQTDPHQRAGSRVRPAALALPRPVALDRPRRSITISL